MLENIHYLTSKTIIKLQPLGHCDWYKNKLKSMKQNIEFKNKPTQICIIFDKYIKAGDNSCCTYGVRTIRYLYVHTHKS